jgi:hypothetical protein
MRPTLVAVVLSASLLASSPWDLWGFLSSIWNGSFVENGCGADPDGRCGSAAAVDNGCGADPNGSRSDSFVEEGCGADPNGSCRPAASVRDNGCIADPNGCPR